MKGVELVHLSSKTCWEDVRYVDNPGISLVSNSSTAFSNNPLLEAEIFNNWLESCCIIVCVILRGKMMRDLT